MSIKNIYEIFNEKITEKNKEVIKNFETVLKGNYKDLEVFVNENKKEDTSSHIFNSYIIDIDNKNSYKGSLRINNDDFDILLKVENRSIEGIAFVMIDNHYTTILTNNHIATRSIEKNMTILAVDNEYLNIFTKTKTNLSNVEKGNVIYKLIFDEEKVTAEDINQLLQNKKFDLVKSNNSTSKESIKYDISEIKDIILLNMDKGSLEEVFINKLLNIKNIIKNENKITKTNKLLK